MNELYQFQRAMRAMRNIAMQRGIIAVLDVGTSKVACLFSSGNLKRLHMIYVSTVLDKLTVT